MNLYALRLSPGDDLRLALSDLVDKNGLEAGCVITAVGSLSQAALRFAEQTETTVLTRPFEILSLSGTLSVHGLHLHMAIADGEGQTLGGHMMTGCLIRTTAEIVIGDLDQFVFRRVLDTQTGYRELNIDQFSS
ncbi:MAG: PPC domain-containing DNA-binding protein [Cyanobacteria bacterium P01_A01_bin.123]